MLALLIPNLQRDLDGKTTKQICSKLRSINIEPVVVNSTDDGFADAAKACDFAVSVGGDGSIIHSAKKLAPYGKPIIGVNVGRLGFMATLEACDIDMLDKIAQNKYTTENRMMLDVSVTVNGVDHCYRALNDAVISKGAISKIIDLELCCNNRPVGDYRADGIIISTPTGSTAYGLSAGGPIISPQIESISMTPICPHSLMSRTILFAASDVLSVKVGENNFDNEVYLTIDGEDALKLDKKSVVTVQKSKEYAKLLKLKDKDFFEVLNEKMLLRAE